MDDTPLNLKALTNLKSISLGSLCLQESDWAFLAGLNQLEVLRLYNCNACSENGLRHIKDLTKLKSLDIQATTLTDGNGLALLGGLRRLERIRLTGRITDRALGRLPALPSLQMFDVTTDVTIRPETVARLKQILPAVRTVNINQPKRQKLPETRPRRRRSPGNPRRINR
jgi:hypothetical protein